MSSPIHEIRVDTLLVADSAQVSNGKLYVIGGGWNFLNLGGPNSPVAAMSLAGRVIVPWSKANRELPFPIQLVHDNGDDLLKEPFSIRLLLQPKPTPDQPPSLETATPFTVDFYGLTFPRPGEYSFVIHHEGLELARVRFRVNFTEYDAAAQSEEREISGTKEP
jgi:hypothetical protein